MRESVFLPRFDGCSMPRAPRAITAPQTGSQEIPVFPAHALVGILECERDKALAQWLFQYDVQHRQQTMMQPAFTQIGHAGQRMARQQQLQHFIKQPRWRHILQQGRKIAEWARRYPHLSAYRAWPQAGPPATFVSDLRDTAAQDRR